VDGPCAAKGAFAPIIGAASGIGWANSGGLVPEGGHLTRDEVKTHAITLGPATGSAAATTDGLSGLVVTTAVLLALLTRARGSGAPTMTVSMLVSSAHALAEELIEYPGIGPAPAPDARLFGTGARYRLYPARKGWVFLAAPAPEDWPALAGGLSDTIDLAADPRFRTEDDRRRHDDELASDLQTVFRERTAAEWEQHLAPRGVACVEVAAEPPEAVLKNEAFGRAYGLVADVHHPTLDDHPRLAPLVRLTRSSTCPGPGCLAGQHTEAILRELGYSTEQIESLRSRAVIAR
jgi:crotonobetainyl-CoA:carnitine CoA-transferase CaiB-like acyl-CoA transferase